LQIPYQKIIKKCKPHEHLDAGTFSVDQATSASIKFDIIAMGPAHHISHYCTEKKINLK